MIGSDLNLVSYGPELEDSLIIEDENFNKLVDEFLKLRIRSILEFKY